VYARKRSVILSLTPSLVALSAFSQSGAVSMDHADASREETIQLFRESQTIAVPALAPVEYFGEQGATPTPLDDSLFASEASLHPDASPGKPPTVLENTPAEGPNDSVTFEKLKPPQRPDFNREIYYRNKLEFSLDAGWLPINVPFPLDIFVGDVYNTYPLKYTLVPIFGSLRWHMSGISGPLILRGNWDLTCTGSITAIPRGPESRYFSWIMGVRRNFVPRNSRVAPYFDIRLGLGHIDAQGPKGVLYAQGEDFTFTVNMGSGVRYNINPRYAISGGLNFMHISNLDLSQGNGKPNWGIRNYGINVYGPMVGIDIQLRKQRQHSE